MSDRMERFFVSALVLALVGFHALTINRQSFFVDEISELAIVRLDPSEIVVKPDSMPPLYSLLLKSWLALWGSDAAARWLSAGCGVGSVVALWAFVRRLVDRPTGVMAATALTVAPIQIYYSQFVRSYSLLLFLAVLACGYFAMAVRSNRTRDWVAFVLASVVGMFTHYYFALLLLTLALWRFAASRGRIGLRFTMAMTAIALLSSPVAVSLQADFGFQKHLRNARPLSLAAFCYTGVSLFSGYTLGPSKVDLQTIPSATAARAIAPWAVAIALGAAPLVWLGGRRLLRHSALGLVLALLLAPTLLAGVLGAALGLTYNVRFVVWCVAPLAVLLGAGVVEGASRWPLRIATALLLVLSAIAISNRQFASRYKNENLSCAAAYLREHAAESEPIVAVSDYMAYPIDYYLGEENRVLGLPTPGERNHIVHDDASVQRASESVEAIADNGAYWLLYVRAFHGDPSGQLLRSLKRRHGLREVARFTGIELYRTDLDHWSSHGQ